MFNNLIESKRKKQRSVGGATMSFILHLALGVAAVYVTAKTAVAEDEEVVEMIEFVETPETPETPPEEPPPPPPPDQVAAPPQPKGFQVLTAPIDIPDVIPEVDLTAKVTDELDFSGKGVAGGIAAGIEGAPAPVVTDQPYFEFQVEKSAERMPNSPAPEYPQMLRSAGIAGRVVAQFVVDTNGRVEMGTVDIIESDHEQFTQSLRRALPRMRFYAAEIGGRKVKQHVQQPFIFAIQ